MINDFLIIFFCSIFFLHRYIKLKKYIHHGNDFFLYPYNIYIRIQACICEGMRVELNKPKRLAHYRTVCSAIFLQIYFFCENITFFGVRLIFLVRNKLKSRIEITWYLININSTFCSLIFFVSIPSWNKHKKILNFLKPKKISINK